MNHVIAEHVRSLRDGGCIVLLDLRSGAYFALNAVGSEVWDALSCGSGPDTAIERLQQRFGAPRERIAADVAALISQFIQKGLLLPRAPSGRFARRAPSVPRRTTHPPASPKVSPASPARVSLRSPRGLLACLEAATALAGVDILLRVAGFDRFHRVIQRLPTRPVRSSDPGRAAALCKAMDVAASFYFKRAWCLQRSAAAACLLRLHGFPADLVIGVRRMPFAAHAWVEIDGVVVNDDPRVCAVHTPIERC